jgi:hypothetical protein
MKRLWVAVCLSAGCATLVYGQFAEPAPIAAVANSTSDSFTAALPPAAAGPAVEESTGLREQFIEQMRRKAELMTDAELKTAIDESSRDVREREAALRLAEIKRLLTDFVQEHEFTKAAQEAGRMLSATDGSFRPL